ncbi:MAG: sugar ABC transporter substrate-binding protein [Lachnospiraceae bacterium]|nr:sugar ABC transporter substrate-binding protein [Lachnospiraceae bacterium]
MKKRLFAMALAGTMVMGSLAGCGSSAADEASSESASSTGEAAAASSSAASGSEDIRISMILKTTSNEYSLLMIAGAEQAGKDLGVSVDVKGATSETAFDEQQNMIETDLNTGDYDAIIIAPSQGATAATLVSGTDIPIFAIDTDFEADEKIAYIGIGQAAASASGAAAGVELAKERGWEDIQCTYIAGIQGETTSEARKTGFQEGLEGAGGTFLAEEVQYANNVADNAVTCMEAIMQNHPEGIAVIGCVNDDCAIGAARAAAGNEAYKDTVFVGFDGNISAAESILEGGETLTIAQSGYDQGYKAVETALQYINGESVESFVECGVQIIGEAEAQEYMEGIKVLLGQE